MAVIATNLIFVLEEIFEMLFTLSLPGNHTDSIFIPPNNAPESLTFCR